MTWPAHALYTLAEFRDFVKVSGNARDTLYADIAGWVASDIERATDRRLVFRAPTEDDDAIYSGAWATGSPAPAAPASPARAIVVTFPSTATAGTLTVTGTVAGVVGVTEVFTVPAQIVGTHVSSLVQYGVKLFSAISALTIAGATGTGTVKVGVSQGYIDYYSPNRSGLRDEIWSNEWPVRQAIVYEDSDRVYGADTLLVEGTDFAIVGQEILVRLSSGGGTSSWARAFRAVKVLDTAGYFGSANLPGTLKRIALRLAALYDQEVDKGQIEIASGSNALGSWTRSGQAALSPQMLRDLAPYTRQGYFEGAERAYDLEAA